MLARAEQGLGNGDDARRLLVAALEQVPPRSREAVSMRLELALNHLMAGEWVAPINLAAARVDFPPGAVAPELLAGGATPLRKFAEENLPAYEEIDRYGQIV